MIEASLLSGQYGSEDDVLREALRALREEENDLTAVRDAVAEWKAGDEGTPLTEAFDEIRRGVETEGIE